MSMTPINLRGNLEQTTTKISKEVKIDEGKNRSNRNNETQNMKRKSIKESKFRCLEQSLRAMLRESFVLTMGMTPMPP